jgi:hypothetical protein
MIIEPMKTMFSQAGFFTYMLGQNFYKTWQSLEGFSNLQLHFDPATRRVFTAFQKVAFAIFCL